MPMPTATETLPDTSSTRNDRNKLRPEDQPVHDRYRFVLSFPPHLVRDYLGRLSVCPKIPFLMLVFFVGCHAAQPSTQPLAPTLSLPPPHPIVADVTQDRVRIQFPTVLNLSYQPVSSAEQITTLQAEADRACGLYGRIASQPISARCISVQLFNGFGSFSTR